MRSLTISGNRIAIGNFCEGAVWMKRSALPVVRGVGAVASARELSKLFLEALANLIGDIIGEHADVLDAGPLEPRSGGGEEAVWWSLPLVREHGGKIESGVVVDGNVENPSTNALSCRGGLR